MAGTLTVGARHLRAEWGRWWRVEDLTDTHLAHRALNSQWRMWEGIRRRYAGEIKANISLLNQQQRQATNMQMMRMAAQRRNSHQGGRYGGYGGGFSMFGGGGASPMVTYQMMRWAQLQIKTGAEHFMPQPVTPPILAAARDQVRTGRHRTTYLLAVLLPAAWIGVWALSPLAALAVTAVTALWFVGLAAVRGRNPRKRRPPIPALLFVPPQEIKGVELVEETEVPFAIREAGTNPRVARDAVRLALKKEARKVAVADVLVPEQTAYGWRVPLVLESGTAGQLVGVLKSVATTLRVGESRVMAQPADPDDAALVTMQILTQDPFANPLPYPERAPLSCTITNPVSLGLSIEGETTPVVLAGQHVIVVADTGGGKTAMVQAITEYVTACRDAVVVDVDPVKRGLKALAPMAVMTARTPAEAEEVLEQLLARALARIASMPPTQDMWIPTPDAPAILAVLEEFPKLSKRGKELAVELLRLGREAMVTIVLITQDATSDVLGDAIADAFGVRIMLPCRAADVPLVVGRADAVSRGWLPHLLVPSPEPGFPADAGRFYCITPRHRTPVLRYVTPLSPAEADRRCRERIAAGLPRLESTSAPAGVPDSAPEIVRLLLAVFAAEGDPEALPVAVIADRLVAADPAVWGRWEGRKDRLAMIGRTLRAQVRAAGVDIPTGRLDSSPGRPTAYRLQDVRGALS